MESLYLSRIEEKIKELLNEELKNLSLKIDKKLEKMATKKDINNLKNNMATKDDFNNLMENINKLNLRIKYNKENIDLLNKQIVYLAIGNKSTENACGEKSFKEIHIADSIISDDFRFFNDDDLL